jgi:phosphotransacetylase
MLSYSTGESGSGEDVDKVRAATALVRELLGPRVGDDGAVAVDEDAVGERHEEDAGDDRDTGTRLDDLERKHKGVTYEKAADTVTDVSYFGTMMVHLGLADGMVSGAAHTTARRCPGRRGSGHRRR